VEAVTNLVTWLRVQLDEDERVALAATPGPWRHNPNKCWRKPGTAWFEEAVFAGPPGAEATCVAGTGETDDQQSMADAQHIARHDPARVLQEVEAKRRWLDELLRLPHYAWDGREEYGCPKATDVEIWRQIFEGDQVCNCGRDEHVDRSLRLLALPYADRPGYLEAWRPIRRPT
jgi:hypothetical protein